MLAWKDALGASGWGKENRSSFGSRTKKLCSLYCQKHAFSVKISCYSNRKVTCFSGFGWSISIWNPYLQMKGWKFLFGLIRLRTRFMVPSLKWLPAQSHDCQFCTVRHENHFKFRISSAKLSAWMLWFCSVLWIWVGWVTSVSVRAIPLWKLNFFQMSCKSFQDNFVINLGELGLRCVNCFKVHLLIW